tara:strand:+ start:560 stop:661 length:102 start_codon:yes stop_codon:yes gene_type:complete
MKHRYGSLIVPVKAKIAAVIIIAQPLILKELEL